MPTWNFLAAYNLIRIATANTPRVLQPTIVSAVPLEISLFPCGADVSLASVGFAVAVVVGVVVGVNVGLAMGVLVGACVGVVVGFAVG
jgi:hypothetical protein